MSRFPALCLCLLLGCFPAAAEGPADAAASAPAVAMLRYGGGKSGECFSKRFLARFNEATDAAVAEEMPKVEAKSIDPTEHRVALLTGEGRFSWKPGEAENLRAFLAGGGLLVASTGCSDPGWTGSLEAGLPELLPPGGGYGPLEDLPVEHPAFGRIFPVPVSDYVKGPPRKPTLLGSHRADGTLAFVWSPEGLNDTLGVQPPCCCCGGNEVRSAAELLVNLLAIGYDAGPAAAAAPAASE